MEDRYRFDFPSCQFGPVDVEDLDRLCVFGQETRPCQKEDFSVNKNLIPVNQNHQNQFEERAFAYCTEEKWLHCTENECPLYDPNYYYNSATILPCAEDFYGCVPYGYCFRGNPNSICDAEDLEDYLSNEKRKEKSRDAARCRRSRETDIFTEMAGALPISTDQAANLDKASVTRLAIAYLKVRALIDAVPALTAKSESSVDFDKFFLKALDGFMLVLSNNGDMIYLSENVSNYLGISQLDMMGQSVFEYSHPCDHEELRESLSTKISDKEKKSCNFFLRLKCTLTNKGRKVNLKSASYKIIHCTGQIISTPQIKKSYGSETGSESESSGAEDEIEKESLASLVVVGCPIPHPSNIEVPLGRQTFLSKHSLNMKFTYADDKLAEYLGWDSKELVGQSVFDFHHANDNGILDKSFKSLFSKGQCETLAYRFLGKKGGFAWVITQATLIYCPKQQKPLSVVCVNYIISGVECEDKIYSLRQLEARSASSNENNLLEQFDSALRPPLLEAVDLLDQPITLKVPVLKIQKVKPKAVTASLFQFPEKPKKEENIFHELVEEEGEGAFDCKQKLIKRNEIRKGIDNFHFVQNENDPPIQNKSEVINERSRPASEIIGNCRFPLAASTFGINQDQPNQFSKVVNKPPPHTATASIFAPRTEDMNTGFLTFDKDQPGLTMLKDEPEDLTHLAPTAGDVCVPLEDPPFLSEILDEFILGNDNYCPLLSPELQPDLENSGLRNPDSLKTNKDLDSSLPDRDPFMYRDSSSRESANTELYSPTMSRSPVRSIDSLCSPSGSRNGFSEDEMLMLSITDVMADDELALRAPYIPMSDQDEALELLINNDMVMWGPTQLNDKKSKWINDTVQEKSNSSLAQLLKNDSHEKKFKDHGGGFVNPAEVLGQIRARGKDIDSGLSNERSNKRVHSSLRSETEYKRIKHDQDERMEVPLNLISTLNEGSQLEPRIGTSKDSSSVGGIGIGGGIRCDDDGGGGDLVRFGIGSGSKSSSSKESNSVLMNLLVSGCDDLKMQHTEILDSQMLGRSKLSTLNINLEEMQTSPPQWSPGSSSLDQLNSNSRSQDSNSNSMSRPWPTVVTTTNFDTLTFDVPAHMQESDLLALDQNLI